MKSIGYCLLIAAAFLVGVLMEGSTFITYAVLGQRVKGKLIFGNSTWDGWSHRKFF